MRLRDLNDPTDVVIERADAVIERRKAGPRPLHVIAREITQELARNLTAETAPRELPNRKKLKNGRF